MTAIKTLALDSFEFLGIPSHVAVIEQCWLHVEGMSRGTHAYTLTKNQVKLFDDGRCLTLQFDFPKDVDRPEFDSICKGQGYQIFAPFNDLGALLYAEINDPRESKLLFAGGTRFRVAPDSLVGEEVIGERRQTFGYWRATGDIRRGANRDKPSLWLQRVDKIEGDNQYKIIHNEYGDNRIETSRNLQGKTLRFAQSNIVIERYVMKKTVRNSLPPFTVNIMVGISAGSVKVIRINGKLDSSFNNHNYRLTSAVRSVRILSPVVEMVGYV